MKRTQLVIMIAIAALMFGGGFYFGSRSGTGSEEGMTSDDQRRFAELKAKMETLSSVDIEEYLALKSMKERYEKADEILGKILTIFIADLGIRSSKSQLAALKARLADESASFLPASAQPVPANRSGMAGGNGAGTAVPGQQTAMTNSSRDFVKQGVRAADVASESEVKDFLKAVEIKDLVAELKGKREMTHHQVDLMTGTFAGKIYLDDPEKNNDAREWEIEMDVQGQIQGGKFVGNDKIRVYRDGKPIGSTRGAGDMRHFMALADDNAAMVVNVMGNSGFAQLYYLPKLDQFRGNYYSQTDYGQYEKAGTIEMTKK